MAKKLANRTPVAVLGLAALASFSLASSAADAAPTPSVVQNPYHDPNPAPVVIDLGPNPERAPIDPPYAESIPFGQLDHYIRPTLGVDDPAPSGLERPGLPDGFSQVGGMVVPTEMTKGAAMVPDAGLLLTDQPRRQLDDHVEEICAFPGDVPPGIYDYDHRPGGETPRFHTVYMNFTGGVLMTGGENSAENISNIARSGHMFPVYAGGEAKAVAISQAVQVDLEPWAVRVVYLERPPKILPYTMVMNGGHYSDTTAGASGGVAPLDCEDFGQRNVCYTFGSNQAATGHANVASQEIGHTLGLGHTNASDSVMAAGYAPTQSGDLGFNNTCAPIIQVQGQGAACVGVNKCHCGGEGDSQHDHNTLFATFSPAGVDMVEPTIAITAPEDGAVFQEGEDFLVEFDPWDDVGGYGWKMIVENEAGEVLVDAVDYDRALFFQLTQLPPDTYTITAVIQDHADHTASDEITVTVEPSADGETGDSGDESGDDGSDESGSDGGDSAGGSGDSDSDGAADGSEDGCGCTTAPSPAPLGLLALLGFLGLRRRD